MVPDQGADSARKRDENLRYAETRPALPKGSVSSSCTIQKIGSPPDEIAVACAMSPSHPLTSCTSIVGKWISANR
jgi:hypothetical protein